MYILSGFNFKFIGPYPLLQTMLQDVNNFFGIGRLGELDLAVISKQVTPHFKSQMIILKYYKTAPKVHT